jgi:ABC-type branched-subunit amino acid transport system substrate-binding protein
VSGSRRTIRRRLGALVLVAAAGTVVLLAPLPGGASATESRTSAVPVDRQAYVIDAPADPYSNETTSLHMGVALGQEAARSFIHLALDRLPADAEVGSVVVTMHVTQKAETGSTSGYETYNVNDAAAVIQACVLTEELKDPFDPAKPPAYDCQHGSAVGVRGEGDAWTFDLTNLVKVWAKAGNTGAALLPIANGPTDTWAISFFKGRSTAKAGYVVPAPPATNGGTRPGASPGYVPIPKTVTGPYPFPTAPPAGPVVQPPPTVAAVPPAPEPPQPVSRARTWMWVLPTCLALAALFLAVSHRPAMAGAGSPFVRLRADVSRQPRAYTLATVATAWGVVFAMYSVIVAPPRLEASPRGNTAPGTEAPGASAAPGASNGPGATATGAPGAGARSRTGLPGSGGPTTQAQGTYRTIGDVRVFFPADGSTPVAQLYSGADDVVGVDYKSRRIKLCGHAAMTYGPAFDIGEEDLTVFFRWWNDRVGAKGWKLDMDLVDDGYDPSKAVKAAQTCKDEGAFMILGGIGFDQIPAVRQWAETNRELYLHHIVTDAGSEGLRYSFTALPSEEKMGEMFGRLAVQKFRGKTVGILWRQSPNWQSGHDLFVKIVKAAGMKVRDFPVRKDSANYTQEIAALNSGPDRADVVFAWENALATVEMLKQAQAQRYYPSWLVFPFNLETNTLGQSALQQPLYGVAAWDAYVPGLYSGGFAPYASEIREFEAAYKKYDPNANLSGDGGDLLFLAWEGFKGLADLIVRCGPDCDRNRMAGTLLTYDHTLGGFCNVDFTRGDGHHGGWNVNLFEAFAGPGGRPGWRPTRRCVERL